MRCWRGCLSGAKCKQFAYGPADAIATPSSLASVIYRMVFTTRCTIVQSAVLRSHVVSPFVCPPVTLVDYNHTGWKSWKLIARTISPTSLLFAAQRSSTYSQGNMEKFWGENVHSTSTSVTSGWLESTERHVILGGHVAVCLLLSVHRAVIFVIAQLSCPVWCQLTQVVLKKRPLNGRSVITISKF